MRNLSLIIIGLTIILITISSRVPKGDHIPLKQPASPHGTSFKVSCDRCHSAKNWKVDKDVFSFDHNLTDMPLIGQHTKIDCKLCHPTLVFSDANNECSECHADVHESTVGKECSRCHTPHSWLVKNITQIHQQSRFPLVGVHSSVDCYQCHKSETFNRFEVLGTECFDCHSEEYAATTQPNHVSSGYSTQCVDCHTVFSKEWKKAGFNHSFFPLTQGHSSINCNQCHTTGTPTKISSECLSCHQADYNAATNPNHQVSNFSTNCTLCHTTAPGWKPAIFNHNLFPLTQGHDIDDCAKCHINGNYTNTPNDCFSCHQTDYNNTTNPGHTALMFSQNCTECHTTNPGWKPASFDHSSFPLSQGHDIDDCAKCHVNGNYTNTPTDCYSCHQADYTGTTNPGHLALGLSENCAECHTTNPGWKPASFRQHDAVSFPIYSGKHQGEWNSCTDCHSNTADYKAFSCLDCHKHNQTDMDNKHRGESGYSYNSNACLNCHPRGSGD